MKLNTHRTDPQAQCHPVPAAEPSLLHIRSVSGYLLTEALVYIGLLFLVLGIGSTAMYRCIDNSVALRRNADDIATSLHAGELWRADVRSAVNGIQLDKAGDEPILRLHRARGEIDYRFAGGALYRRQGGGDWSRVLSHVKASSMIPDFRADIEAWRWELEIEPQARASFKPGRITPLFTFLAVRSRQ